MIWSNFFRRTVSALFIVSIIFFTAVTHAETPQEAIQRCTAAIKANPNDYEAYNDLGGAYYYLKDHKKAIGYFDTAIQLNPNFDWAYNNRGETYKELGQYDLAIQDFEKALWINPDHDTARKNLKEAIRLRDEQKSKSINLQGLTGIKITPAK